jgi:hypothetical protein
MAARRVGQRDLPRPGSPAALQFRPAVNQPPVLRARLKLALCTLAAQMAKDYCREIVRVLRMLKEKRDMGLNEVRLTVAIEDPRARERRLMGMEVSCHTAGEYGRHVALVAECRHRRSSSGACRLSIPVVLERRVLVGHWLHVVVGWLVCGAQRQRRGLCSAAPAEGVKCRGARVQQVQQRH